MSEHTLGANAPSLPSRRSFLGTAVAAGAALVAVPAVAAAPTVDPVFGLIAEHHRLWDFISTGLDAEQERIASNAEAACLDKILATVPQSTAGMLAWLHHLETDLGFGGSQVDEPQFVLMLATFKSFVMRGEMAQ